MLSPNTQHADRTRQLSRVLMGPKAPKFGPKPIPSLTSQRLGIPYPRRESLHTKSSPFSTLSDLSLFSLSLLNNGSRRRPRRFNQLLWRSPPSITLDLSPRILSSISISPPHHPLPLILHSPPSHLHAPPPLHPLHRIHRRRRREYR